MKNDTNNRAISCIVMFHDLLGYSNLVASSCGTLDSAVGEIALNRLCNLRNSLDSVSKYFPPKTELFHFNDSVIATLDIDVDIGSQLIDPSGIASSNLKEEEVNKILTFLGASAKMHQKTLSSEEELKIGPGGRTFVVIGSRWDIQPFNDKSINDLQKFQANLAYSEAFIADSLGSKAGFNKRIFNSLYINDYLDFILKVAKLSLKPDRLLELNQLGLPTSNFPENIYSIDEKEIKIEIFHRERSFYSLMSYHTCFIN